MLDRRKIFVIVTLFFHFTLYFGGWVQKLWLHEEPYPWIWCISLVLTLLLFLGTFAACARDKNIFALIPLILIYIWDCVGLLAAAFLSKERTVLDMNMFYLAGLLAGVSILLLAFNSTAKKRIRKYRLAFVLPFTIHIFALVVLLSGVFIGIFTYPDTYIHRLIQYGNSDINDYKIFPERLISNGKEVDGEYSWDVDLTSSLIDQFLLEKGISDTSKFLRENKTTSFLVLHNGVLIYEDYFGGLNRDKVATSFSMAKSFDSLLVGFAIQDGYIQSVDDKIAKYIPELAERDPLFNEITIKDLLTMTSGIRYSDSKYLGGTDLPWDDNPKTYYYRDLRFLAIDTIEIDSAPGEYFQYNNYNPLLVGIILERATKMRVSYYLSEKVWKPLEMGYDASWSLDSKESGFEKMESGLNVRPRDYLLVGEMLANGGKVEGEQIISEEWVRKSTQSVYEAGEKNETFFKGDFKPDGEEMYYSHFWWGFYDEDEQSQNDFLAAGHLGQYLYISPKNDLVILRTGSDTGDVDWMDLLNEISTWVNEQEL